MNILVGVFKFIYLFIAINYFLLWRGGGISGQASIVDL